MKFNLKLSVALSLILISNILFSQVPTAGLGLDELEKITDAISTSDIDTSQLIETNTNQDYRSTVKQIKKISNQQLLKTANIELQKKRIDLAVRLCQEDENACYLIENYHYYKNKAVADPNDELKVFGIDFFSNYPLQFDQTSVSNVSKNYKLSIGDIVKVNIYGNETLSSELVIDNNGAIASKLLNPLYVAGLSISDAQNILNDNLKENFIGSYGYLSLVSAKGIEVFALGSINTPGGYTISAGSSALNLLVAAGGFTNTSSLRNVSLIRDGEKLAEIDLYDLLIFGDSSSKVSLIDGDSVLINPIKDSVTISGEVLRPAIYEIKPGETISDIIEFALGTTSRANDKSISIQRRDELGNILTYTISIEEDFVLQDGDFIEIFPLSDKDLDSVSKVGTIRNPGISKFSKNLMMKDILRIETDALKDTYRGLVVVKRTDIALGSDDYLFLNPQDIESFNNFEIQPLDIFFFLSKQDVEFLNSELIVNFLNSNQTFNIFARDFLETWTDYNYQDIECLSFLKTFGGNAFLDSARKKLSFSPKIENAVCTDLYQNYPDLLPILINQAASLTGSFRSPGLYPAAPGINSEYLVKIAGGDLFSRSDEEKLYEVGSYSTGFLETPYSKLSSIKDAYFINSISKSEYSSNGFIELVGEFQFPGTYPITSFETIQDIYKRAGGLTPQAFPLGAIFTREAIKSKEATLLSKIEAELTDILTSAVTSGVINSSPADVLTIIEAMQQVANTKATGRLVTELNPIKLNSDPALDIVLQDGDILYMPKIQNTITIMGSVLNPVTVPFNENLSVNDFIDLAGGFQDSADKSRIYIVFPNGAAKPYNKKLFFNSSDLIPGSAIIVSREARPLSGLSLVEAVSPILANLSLTLASINSISNN